MKAFDFDKLLSGSDSLDKPRYVIIHPHLWNGKWRLRYHLANGVSSFIRKLGRTFSNKYIYWLGLPIYWEKGVKDYINL